MPAFEGDHGSERHAPAESPAYNLAMRYVAGTFDAPVPASAGMRALELSGVPRADIRVLRPVNGDRASEPDTENLSDVSAGAAGDSQHGSQAAAAHHAPAADTRSAGHDLLAAEDAATLAKIMQPGLVVVLARVPTARAAAAAAALRAVGAGRVTESLSPPRG